MIVSKLNVLVDTWILDGPFVRDAWEIYYKENLFMRSVVTIYIRLCWLANVWDE